jgi:hypothetical protein
VVPLFLKSASSRHSSRGHSNSKLVFKSLFHVTALAAVAAAVAASMTDHALTVNELYIHYQLSALPWDSQGEKACLCVYATA